MGVTVFVESTSHARLAIRQTELLLSGLLSNQSGLHFDEVPVPPEILNGFVSYRSKENRKRFIEMMQKRGLVEDVTVINSAEVRAFRLRSSGIAAAAAMAFPFERYSSLIFFREDFHNLSPAHKFQLYHELGHGTPEGVNVMLRPIRWHVAEPFSKITIVSVSFGLFVCLFSNVSSTIVWSSFVLLLLAYVWRRKALSVVIEFTTAASEALADSVALSHPDFSVDDAWKIRADNQAARLDDELKDLEVMHPRYFEVMYRAATIRRWIKLDKTGPYLSGDVDPSLLPICMLFGAVGYLAPFTTVWGAVAYWVILSIVFGLILQLARNGMYTELMLRKVDAALTSKI